MKKVKLGPAMLTGLFALALIIGISCSKEDSIEQFGTTNNTGSDNLSVGTPTATWTIDKAHSNVGWSTLYYGDNAMLTGRFNMFNVEINFDQANLAQSNIKAWVQLSTFNTGEPGRDGYRKCGPGYMGVQWDTIAKKPIPTTDTAWFKSTSIIKSGNGYLAKGDLIFRGITKPTDMFFTYAGIHEYEKDGVKTYRAGFNGHFKMLANTDFKVNSTSIADEVTVTTNVNVVKKK
jgi:polyisoprenoid-binding protein YceI